MDKISLTIDGVRVKTDKGVTLLQAAREAGRYIPTLCSRPDLSLPLGGCRLCVVEVEGGQSRFPTSCTTVVAKDMVVHTGTPIVQEIRRHNLIALLSPLPAPRLNRKELKKLAEYIGVAEKDIPRYISRNLPVDRDEPLFELDHNRCILCGLCVRACKDMRGVGALSFVFQDSRLAIGSNHDTSLDENGCRFCGACVEVCPTGAIAYKEEVPGYEEGVAPCVNACPAGIDVPRYVHLVGQRRFAEAAAVVREKVPFPGVLGQICPHPCEVDCLRGQLNEPVSIAALKRVAAERDTRFTAAAPEKAKPTGKKVAVVGSGPAGLTAAYYLAKLGHSVTVFEALSKAGGMMQAEIPEYRLPRTVLNPEIDQIERIGVEIKTGSRIENISKLIKDGYDAVLLAVGTHRAIKLDVPGRDSKGILEAISFLRDVNLRKDVKLHGKVGVIGGGSVAIDAARTAVRLGAKDVQLICLETREEMPAYEDEIQQAIEEGIEINCSWGVKSIAGTGGVVGGIDCIRCVSVFDENGKFSPKFSEAAKKSFKLGTLIIAIGQAPDLSFLGAGSKVQSTPAGTIKVDKSSLETESKGVFAAGDAVSGPSTVIAAIAMSRKAASSIDRYLGGKGIIREKLVATEEVSPCLGPWHGFAGLSRIQMPCLPADKRTSFAEVESGFSEQMAIDEANRCLQCQLKFLIKPVAAAPVSSRRK